MSKEQQDTLLRLQAFINDEKNVRLSCGATSHSHNQCTSRSERSAEMRALVKKMQDLIIGDNDPTVVEKDDVMNMEKEPTTAEGSTKMDVDQQGEAKPEKQDRSKAQVIDLDLEEIMNKPAYDTVWYYDEPCELSDLGDLMSGGDLCFERHRVAGRSPRTRDELTQVLQQSSGARSHFFYVSREEYMSEDNQEKIKFFAEKFKYYKGLKVETKMGSLSIMPCTGASFSRGALFGGIEYGTCQRQHIPLESSTRSFVIKSAQDVRNDLVDIVTAFHVMKLDG